MSQRERTKAYWEKRANERLTRSERITKSYMAKLSRVYAESSRRLTRQLKNIYSVYYRENGFNVDALRQIVPDGEISQFTKSLKDQGLPTTLPENYKGRVTRLKMLQAQIQAEANKIAVAQQMIDTNALSNVFVDSYYRAGFDVARGIGSTPSGFTTLDRQTIDKVLNTRFEGANYKKRVWGNTDKLAKNLKGILATAIATGQSIEKTSADVRQQMHVSQYKAERLVRTESNHFHNSAELEAYKRMGFEKFKFMATLDNRTSEICAEMDGKIFDVKDGMPGDNVPPLHPNCRSTIVPYFEGYEPTTRMARNPATGKNYYAYKMTYNDWRQGYIDAVVNNVKTGVMVGDKVLTDYGVNFDSKSLWGVDGKIIKSYSEQLEKLMSEYETVKDWSYEQRKVGLKINGSDRRTRAIAWCNRLNPTITLNTKYHFNKQKIMKTVKKGIKSGHFMPSKTLSNYVINHEFGHYVENCLMAKTGKSYDAIANGIIKIANERYGMAMSDLSKTISGYGKRNNAEFFAECFANAKGGRPNALGKAMNDYLKENLK